MQKGDLCHQISQDPNKYRVQIIYTQIDRDKKNKPHFTSHYFNVSDSLYFYPASTVKLPACVLALEKLNKLKIKNINKESPFLTDSAYSGQYRIWKDSTNIENHGIPTIAHYIKQILLVSDNEAYNRLYEFIGQAPFNQSLHQKGYKSARIVHRLSIPLSIDENRHTNPIFLGITDFKDSLKAAYRQPLQSSSMPKFSEKNLLGKGEKIGDNVVYEPKDFSYKNNWSLKDQHELLKHILFPESQNRKNRFRLTSQDYEFLYKYLSMLPSESTCPKYDSSYYDAYVKFFIFGNQKDKWPNKNLRIYNKVGDAYGFLIDNAYIVDFEKKVEFLVSAVIYCNSDGIFNDDIYDYDTIGFPFFQALGTALYEYECTRQKLYLPDLSRFK